MEECICGLTTDDDVSVVLHCNIFVTCNTIQHRVVATGGGTLKVNICGIEHSVIECEDNFDTETHMGQIDYGKCMIKINKDMPCQLKTAILCHEILHGMLIHIGREDLSEDEQLITALGNAINNAFLVKEG